MARPNNSISFTTKEDSERFEKFIKTFASTQPKTLHTYIYYLKKIPVKYLDNLVNSKTEDEARIHSNELIMFFQRNTNANNSFNYMKQFKYICFAVKKYLISELNYTTKAIFTSVTKELTPIKKDKGLTIKHVPPEVYEALIKSSKYRWVWKSQAPKEIADDLRFKGNQQVLIERTGYNKDMWLLLIETLGNSGLRIAESMQIVFKNFYIEKTKEKNKTIETYRISLEGIGKGGKSGKRFTTKYIYDKIMDFKEKYKKNDRDIIFDVKINYDVSTMKKIGSFKVGNVAGSSAYKLSRKINYAQAEFRRIGKTVSFFDSENSFTPHMLRHMVGFMLYKKGMPLDQIQTVLGHSDISTTQVYAHASDSEIGMKFGNLMDKEDE